MNISEISNLLSRSTDNLNTLNGIGNIQWTEGYKCSINSVYYEAYSYRDVSGNLEKDGLIALAQYCSDIQERISLSGDDKFPFLDGMHSGCQTAKDVINESLNKL